MQSILINYFSQVSSATSPLHGGKSPYTPFCELNMSHILAGHRGFVGGTHYCDNWMPPFYRVSHIEIENLPRHCERNEAIS